MGKRRAGRQDQRDTEQEVATILAGRRDVPVRRLVELIHEVNPTGRDLPSQESERRYAIKSRLQSMLVRRFGGELEVRTDPQAPGAVSIRHRYSDLPASHAVVETLDDDARSWVRFKLDTELVASAAGSTETRPVGATEPDGADREPARGRLAEPAVGHADGASPADLLRLGREALEAFDYPLAQERMTAAFRGSGGGRDAALALLELLVDHLGMDQEALDLGPGLAAEASADPTIRSFFALAAARSADRDAALRWTKGADGAHVADAYLALAVSAVQARELVEADGFLSTVRERDPSRPEVAQLEKDLDIVRADLRRPLEEELARRVAEGPVDEAERLARRLLEAHPESAVARRTLREIEENARTARADALLREAESALTSGSASRAADLLRQAEALGRQREDLAQEVAKAIEADRLRTDTERVRSVADMLTGADPVAGVEAYLALDTDLRPRVRAPGTSPLPGWADEIGWWGTGARARQIGEALAALCRAADTLGRGDADAALALLTPHEKTLISVQQAKQVLAEARVAVVQRRRADAQHDLEAASRAAEVGDDAVARHLIESLDVRMLTDDERGVAAELTARLRRREEAMARAKRLEALEAAGDFLAARDETGRLVALTEGAERERWSTRRAELDLRLRRSWRLATRTWPDAEGPELPLELVADVSQPEGGCVWLAEDGTRMVVATAHGRRLFVRVLGVTDRRLRATARIQTPEPLGYLDAHLEGDELWLVGDQAVVLAISLTTWEILRWFVPHDLVGPHETIEDTLVVPGAGVLWMQLTDTRFGGPGRDRLLVVDLDDGKVRRTIDNKAVKLMSIWTDHGAWVGCCGLSRGNVLCRPDGVAVTGVTLPSDCSVHALAPHPSEPGLLALVSHPDETGDDDGRPLEVFELAVDGTVRSSLTIEESEAVRPHALVSSRKTGLAFVLHAADGWSARLVTLRKEGGTLRVLHATDVDGETILLGDAVARNAAAVLAGAGFQIARLGDTPPQLADEQRTWIERSLPKMTPPFYCCPLGGGSPAHQDALHASLRTTPLPKRARWVAGYRAEHGESAADLLDLARALELTAERELADQVFRDAWERHPDDPLLALLHADALAERGDWLGVRELLAAVDTTVLPEGFSRHRCHLLGIALLDGGDVEGARKAWEEGLAHESAAWSDCQLDACLALLAPDGESDDAAGSTEARFVRALVGAIRQADRFLEAGGFDRVRDLLGRPAIVRCRELQSLARLVQAHLSSEPMDDVQSFAKAMTLACFVEAHDDPRHLLATDLPIPGVSWSKERLAEVAARARAWLDRDDAGGSGRP